MERIYTEVCSGTPL